MSRTQAPFGTWPSPIRPDDLLRGALGLGFPRFVDGEQSCELYWMEARPAEAGRTAILRRGTDGSVEDCLPAPYSARSRVHEYGGSCYTVADERLYFVNFSDQRIYVADLSQPEAAPQPVTADDQRRYADLQHDASRQRLIVVAEEDRPEGEPRNFLAAIPLTEEPGRARCIELVAGQDFYSGPRLDPTGERLLWLSWDHPAMPWDGCGLWQASFGADGLLEAPTLLAGGPTESIFQPEFTADGAVVAISDRSGWWNLERITSDGRQPLLPKQADFGLPLWQFGMRTWCELGDGRLACTWQEASGDQLGILDPASGQVELLSLPWTQIASPVACGGTLAFIAASPQCFPELVRHELGRGHSEVIRRSSSLELAPEDIAIPEPLGYPTGAEGSGEIAHAYYYPPTHRQHQGPDGERPPLLVMSHGGPTAATAPVLNLKAQFWTSRGFAVLDVNYRGSTGYGRAYRDRLAGGWGVVDVEDCVAGARFLVDRGDVDPQRLAIRGSSAGGFTTLAALTFHDTFRAGASLYGIGDLEALAQDTHKFEARYLDRLVGPYPEAIDVYRARSPIHHVDSLDCPVIFLQGLEDRIVPPAQAEAMVAALDAKGLPVAYVPFEGEQHGFRQAANIRRALEAELYFYSRVFGFTPADSLEPIPIRNLDPPAAAD